MSDLSDSSEIWRNAAFVRFVAKYPICGICNDYPDLRVIVIDAVFVTIVAFDTKCVDTPNNNTKYPK